MTQIHGVCFLIQKTCLMMLCHSVMLHGDEDKGFINDLIHLNPLLNPIKEQIKNDQFAIVNNPDKYKAAYVRQRKSPLSAEELFWRKRRLAVIKKAQEKFLGISLDDDEVLEIGISCSGGGFRAMLGSLGSLRIAQETGLLDCVMSVASLSGSTWCVAPWIASGMSLAEYKNYLLPKLEWGLLPDHVHEFTNIIDRLLVKFAYEQPLSVVDLYGGLIANTLLEWCSKECLDVYMSATIHNHTPSQAKRIAYARYPFPVYTAVLGDMDCTQEWFEFTPYEVGCRAFEAYVPAWGFGRKFEKGKSIDNAPEQSLGYLLGIFGSAFAFNLEQAYDNVIKHLIDYPYLKPLIESLVYSEVGKIRFGYAEIYNFMYNMPQFALHKRKTIKLVDAGFEFMNPIFATYRKDPHGSAPDMVIALDYSEYDLGMPQLSLIARYASRNKLKFPVIHDKACAIRTLTVFKDETDVSIPSILYMPRVKDRTLLEQVKHNVTFARYVRLLANVDWEYIVTQGYAKTYNLHYTKGQAELVCALHEFNMLANIENIRNEMKERVMLKRKLKG